MAKPTDAAASQGLRSKILMPLLAIVCLGSLVFVIVDIALHFITPTTVPRLQLVQGVPLPGVLADAHGQLLDQSLQSDRFDFQAYDPTSGLLFIAHPGPSARKLQILQSIHGIPAGTHLQTSIAVFDARDNKFMGSILSAQFVHGIAVAANLHKVYAAAAGLTTAGNKIYVIDESSCKPTPSDQDACRVIKTLTPSATPDSVGYDPVHEEVFVADPGLGLDVIDARTDQIVHVIRLNTDVGHVRYDPASQRIFAVIVPSVTTKSEIAVINPITFNIQRFTLPSTCNDAHGLILDPQQQVGFAACVANDKVAMFSMRTLRPIGDVQNLQSTGVTPDIVEIDTGLHILYIGSKTAISVYDESQAARGILRKLGDYAVDNGDMHSIAVNETTHDLYVPALDLGGRPVLLIEHFNPQGNA